MFKQPKKAYVIRTEMELEEIKENEDMSKQAK
jgi:hypothetical protein